MTRPTARPAPVITHGAWAARSRKKPKTKSEFTFTRTVRLLKQEQTRKNRQFCKETAYVVFKCPKR